MMQLMKATREVRRVSAELLGMTTVLAAAVPIEPSRERRLAWYHEVPIHALGDRTAEEVVRHGEASRVIALLRLIREMERRDRWPGAC